MNHRNHSVLGLRITSAALIASLAFAAPAFAVPSTPAASSESTAVLDARTSAFRAELAAKQARLEEFKAQLDALDRELGIASEAYNASVEELAATRNRLSATQIDLGNAETAYGAQSELLQERARSIYRAGELDVLDLLIGAKSLPDLVGRLRFLNALGESDADIAATLRAQRDQISQTADDLKSAEQKAAELEFTLKARQIEVLLRIEDRQKLLAEAETDLLDLLDSEAGHRQSEEAAFMREILS
ncbi:MAG: hypothetical protein Q8S43_10010, partial [Actinomycetota bacterium]|nr:hypothetical protein [Actinomycetota bacterium]